MRLLPLASRGIQRTQATVAVRLERTHAQHFGEGERVLIMGLGQLDVRRLVSGSDITEQAQHIRLMPPLLMVTGKGKGPPSKLDRLFYTAC